MTEGITITSARLLLIAGLIFGGGAFVGLLAGLSAAVVVARLMLGGGS